jgi:hypothetical protein
MKTATFASLASAMVFLTLVPSPATASYQEWREWTTPGDEFIMGTRSDFLQYLQFPQISVANRQKMTRAGETLFTRAYPFVNQKVRLWDAQFKTDFGNSTTVHPVTRMTNLRARAATLTEKDFQYEFSHIFSSMGDRHTFYTFPMPHSCVSATLGLVYKHWAQYQVAVEGAIPVQSITGFMYITGNPLRNRTHIISAYDGVPAATYINRERWELYGMQPSTITPFFGARLVHTDGMIAQLPDKANMTFTFTDPANLVPSYNATLSWVFGVKRSCIRTYHALSGTPNPYLVKRQSNPTVPISVPTWQRIPSTELPENGTPLAFTQFRNTMFKLPDNKVVDPMSNIIRANGTTLQKRQTQSIPYTDIPGFEGIMGWKIDTDPITGLAYSVLKINAFVFPGRFNEMVMTIRNLILTELSRTPYLVIDLSDNPGGFIGSGQALVQLISNVEILPHYNYMLNEQAVISFVSNGRTTRVFTGDALMNQYENTTFVYDRADWERKRVEYNQFGRVWSQVSVVGGNAQTGSTAGMTAAMALEAGIPRLNLNGNSADSASQFGWYSAIRGADWEELPQTFKDAPTLLRQEMYLSLTRMKGQSEFNEGELSGLPWEDRPNAELANFLPLAIYRSADKIARVTVNRVNYTLTDYVTGAIAGNPAQFRLNVTNRDGIVGYSSTYQVTTSASTIPTLSGPINHNTAIILNVSIPATTQSTTTRFNFAVNGTSTVLLVDIAPARSAYYPLSATNPLVQGGVANFSNPVFNPWFGTYRKFIADPIPSPSADNRTLVFFPERGDRGRSSVSFFTRTTTVGRISGRFNYTAGLPFNPTERGFPVADRTTLSLTVYYNTTLVASLPLDKTARRTGIIASYDSVTSIPANTGVEFRITYDANTKWDYGFFQLNTVNINLN